MRTWLALSLGLSAICGCPGDDDGDDAAQDGGANGRADGGGAGDDAVRDPAPEFTMPGEYGCDGCPDADIAAFELEVASDTSRGFNGFVSNADGPGEFYLESEDGQRIGGLIPTDDTGSYGFTVPLFCGTQLLKCLWSNAEGTYVAVVEIVVTDCIEADIRITLSWDDQGDDFDLHLIREGGSINDDVNDCTWNTCQSGTLDWGVQGDASDDPRKDVDSTGTFGPENIFYAKPENGTYTVMVEHWGTGEPEADGFVTINVIDQPPVVVAISNLAPQHVYTAATIEWPSGTVTEVDQTFDCTAEWSGGCEAALP